MTDDTIIVTDTHHNVSRASPVHLWIIGLFALLWNGFAAYNYTMSQLRDDAFARQMMPDTDPAAIYAYMDAMPIWASTGWALGVWGGLIGAVLLLARSRHAVAAFAISLVGVILSFGYQLFVATDKPTGMDDPIIPIAVVTIALALLFYARAMRAKGVLR